MTSAELDALAELEKKATPGPWLVETDEADTETWISSASGVSEDVAVECVGWNDHQYTREDARLIAAARNSLPVLIEAARAVERMAHGEAYLTAERDEARRRAKGLEEVLEYVVRFGNLNNQAHEKIRGALAKVPT